MSFEKFTKCVSNHLLKVLFSAVLALVLFCSCAKSINIVSFDSNGGSLVLSQTVTEGEKATEPFPAPSKTGNEFVGWFSYDNVFDKWDFMTQAIISDITLYAKWTTNAIENSAGKRTVLLMERDDYEIFKKTIILFEDDNYFIIIPLFNFLSDVNDFLIKIRTKGDSKLDPLIEQILSDGKKKNLLYASSYFREQPMLDNILAIFLVNGQCYVFDKRNKNTIKQVFIERWETIGELSPFGGRIFYFQDNIQFLKTIDWYWSYL